MQNWFRLLPDVFDLLHDVSTDTTSTSTSRTSSGGAGGKPPYLRPYSVEKYSCFRFPKHDAHWFAIFPSGEVITTRAGYKKRGTAFGLA